MGLLQEAKNEMAFAKIGFLGFAGTGKTYTATELAIGLWKMIKSEKPIAYLDTETGVDYVLPKMKKEGLPAPLVAKTRAFKDLMEVTHEAQGVSDILIVDSISHVWTDLLESYLDKKGKKDMAFQDWNIIKPTWRTFTDLYLTANIHIIICGRAGYEWDYYKDDETEKMVLHKTGTKMKAETEFGFEPSLLIEMERVRAEGDPNEIQRKFVRRAYVLKDRSDVLDGMTFDNPTFKNFLPFFETLALGAEHHALDTERDSRDMFEKETGKPEWKKKKEQIQITLEELDAELSKTFPGSTKEEKQGRIAMCEYLFGTSSKTKIEILDLTLLRSGLKELKRVRNLDMITDILAGGTTHDDFKKQQGPNEQKQALITEIEDMISLVDDSDKAEEVFEGKGIEPSALEMASFEDLQEIKKELNSLIDKQVG